MHVTSLRYESSFQLLMDRRLAGVENHHFVPVATLAAQLCNVLLSLGHTKARRRSDRS